MEHATALIARPRVSFSDPKNAHRDRAYHVLYRPGAYFLWRKTMQKIVRNVSLAVVALGVMFVMTVPARADNCCAPPAACCVTVHHCHHYWHRRHVCCPVTVTPSCGCTTCAPVVTVAAPTVAPCTTCCTVPAVRYRCRMHCAPICGQ